MARTDTSTPAAFAAEFERLVRDLERSSNSSVKNHPLESFMAAQTGWSAIAVKSISSSKQLGNRLREILNRPDRARHALLIVPHTLVEAALEKATASVRDKSRLTVVAIAGVARGRVTISDIVFGPGQTVPPILSAAFPDLKEHPLSSTDPVDMFSVSDSASNVSEASTSDDLESDDIGVSAEQLAAWHRRLLRKKQIVLQGPPGTGKTYLAKYLARTFVQDPETHCEIVQFHPSYSYEDFVRGIRVSVKDGHPHYAVQPGRFLDFCRRAGEVPEAPFVLVIDEINRGNLSRIFGELLYLLEYREESISLAQGEEPFSVPDNVYLIATMNTADRSIALVDHAFRRRFSFIFLAPNLPHLQASLLARGLDDGGALVRVLEQINQRIDDRNYHLGTSFFLAPDVDLRENLPEIWDGEIVPYLEEHFFDQMSKVDEFRWETLVKSSLAWWLQPDGSD